MLRRDFIAGLMASAAVGPALAKSIPNPAYVKPALEGSVHIGETVTIALGNWQYPVGTVIEVCQKSSNAMVVFTPEPYTMKQGDGFVEMEVKAVCRPIAEGETLHKGDPAFVDGECRIRLAGVRGEKGPSGPVGWVLEDHHAR